MRRLGASMLAVAGVVACVPTPLGDRGLDATASEPGADSGGADTGSFATPSTETGTEGSVADAASDGGPSAETGHDAASVGDADATVDAGEKDAAARDATTDRDAGADAAPGDAASDVGVDACRPARCADLGYTCGSWDNHCGGVVPCGNCPTGKYCSTQGACAAWARTELGTNVAKQNHVAVGAARGDDVGRVYSTDTQIHEYSFDVDAGSWATNTFGPNFLTQSGLGIGRVRNDGVDRLYATDYSVYEYSYRAGAWASGPTYGSGGETTIIDNQFVIGDGRGDGLNRLYIGDRNGVIELTNNQGTWAALSVNNQAYARSAIADGRNVGTSSLYTVIGTAIWEYRYVGGAFVPSECASLSGYNGLLDVAAGGARNDGTNRVYGASDNGVLYELTFDGAAWQTSTVSAGTTARRVVIGAGRNDGVARIYTLDASGLGEWSWSSGVGWAKTSLLDDTTTTGGDIAIGYGRGDRQGRVYVASSNHLYEYSVP